MHSCCEHLFPYNGYGRGHYFLNSGPFKDFGHLFNPSYHSIYNTYYEKSPNFYGSHGYESYEPDYWKYFLSIESDTEFLVNQLFHSSDGNDLHYQHIW